MDEPRPSAKWKKGTFVSHLIPVTDEISRRPDAIAGTHARDSQTNLQAAISSSRHAASPSPTYDKPFDREEGRFSTTFRATAHSQPAWPEPIQSTAGRSKSQRRREGRKRHEAENAACRRALDQVEVCEPTAEDEQRLQSLLEKPPLWVEDVEWV